MATETEAVAAEAPAKIKGKSGGRPQKANGKTQKPKADKILAKQQNPDPVKVDWSAWPKVTIPLATIDRSNRYRKEYKKIPELAASIAAVGMLQPIVVGPQNPLTALYPLIGGGRRCAALEHMGQTEAVCVVADYTADPDKAAELILRAELEENDQRMDFEYDEKMKLVGDLEKYLGTQGKAKPGQTPRREKIAAAVGLSHESVRLAKAVEKAAKEDPAKFGHLTENLRKNETTIGRAYKEMKALQTPAQDGAGLFLPPAPKVAEVWQSVAAFEELQKALTRCRAALNAVANSPGGGRLVAAGKLRTRVAGDGVAYSDDGLSALFSLVKESRPYAQCPTCAAAHQALGKYDKKCPTCLGTGHVGEKALETLAEAKDAGVAALKKLSKEAAEAAKKD